MRGAQRVWWRRHIRRKRFELLLQRCELLSLAPLQVDEDQYSDGYHSKYGAKDCTNRERRVAQSAERRVRRLQFVDDGPDGLRLAGARERLLVGKAQVVLGRAHARERSSLRVPLRPVLLDAIGAGCLRPAGVVALTDAVYICVTHSLMYVNVVAADVIGSTT